ncbi:MAG: ferritin family protein [Planctomycetota bacterium]|jgi:rubrerythrin
MDVDRELAEALETSRKSELEGWQLYISAARRTSHPGVRETFLSLAREEEHHMRDIEVLARGRFRRRGGRKVGCSEVAGLLELRGADLSDRVRRVRTDAEALDLAVELEDDACCFYRECAQRSSATRVRAFFERMSAEEHDHGELLRKIRAGLDAAGA